ncbi:alpha carbonic anhydrase 4-like [Andrographis paniculata]|uniref:alpha carbonic anhydrase 4-like n=1 Tax=Andrographis paniculata TaxID=175694 RepID=UPI0021E8598E|nr:alpha carbonic anhydrase 4-like [Andrographis paniculata]
MDFDDKSFVLSLLKSLILMLFLFATAKAVTNPEVEDETSFSYVIGAPDGPQNWGNLNPNWTLCNTGRRQSPINIIYFQAVPRPLGDLIRQYQAAPAVLKNRGRDIEVEWTGDAGGIVIKGTYYELVQCHWHIPAEHKINGVRKNMELHIVHESPQGNIAVVAYLYIIGPADPFLERFIPFLPSNRQGVSVGVVDPSDIGFSSREYYRYNGSLTVPPCSENVTWTVFRKEKTVSPQQISALQNSVNNGITGNARPIQPLNGRTVYVYRPN